MIRQRGTEDFDAIVVGARCAGASTAMLLARSGARVLCVDYSQPGSDTLSTHALMRAGVIQLYRWGVLSAIQAAQTPAVTRTVFDYGDDVSVVQIRPSLGVDALYAPRRTVLDLALVRAAAESSVTFRFGTACTGLVEGTGGRIAGARLKGPGGREEVVRAGVVIGADGRRSGIARRVGARTLWQGRHAASVIYGYVDGLPNEGYRTYYANGIAGGIFPTNDGLSCVFLSMPPADFARDLRGGAEGTWRAAAMQRLPSLGRVIAGAALVTPLLAFAGEPGFLRQSQGPGWALVGDAGYFKDPATAHGITDALRDAEILSRSIIDGKPESYEPVRAALVADFFRQTDAIASFDWSISQLKARHLALNAAMKAGQTWILEQDLQPAVAA